MDESLRDALCAWLLSSDRLPDALAEALVITTITPYPLTAWRFQGMWRREYAGQLGRLRQQQLPATRDNDDDAAQPTELVLARVDGEEEAPFDEVAFDGLLPEPPDVGWCRRSARRAASAWREVAPDPETWARLGAPRVAAVADRALERRLGSPDLMDLAVEPEARPGALHRAEVVFWEVSGTHAGRPLRGVVGPDGAVWGEPPSSEGAAEAAAPVALLGAGWTLATLLGLLAFVVPGVIIGAVGALHVRHRLGAGERRLAARRRQQRGAIRALVERSLSG